MANDDVEWQSPQRVRAIRLARGDGQWVERIRIVPRGRRAPGLHGEVGRCTQTGAEQDESDQHDPIGSRQANWAVWVARGGAGGR